ncbi:alpha/beta hydrolase [Sphingobium lignivorans]|uniref:Acetyl esterase/lipase n=1 Tax=Sphingobium lignivorans TaxID=2735886 RepID=A0ABR6NBV2_9SPHN|nr:alpha/beta hydrolase [Sphingobium lignivorans]MBB5984769.1 acetyl esterase/lipase [Sphingobium lignivorans]
MIADIPYRHLAGWQGMLDIHLPAGDGPHPALLYLHGGGWRMGDKTAVAAHAPFWSAMGLAVVSASYRLADEAPAPAAFEDAAAALDWLGDEGAAYGIDTTRLLIGGHSAGATLALAVAYTHARQPRAALAWSAHADLAAYHDERKRAGEPVAWLAASADPNGLARALSPQALARPGLPSTLLVHSDRDPRVPYAAAARLAASLSGHGVCAELVTMRSDHHLPKDHPPDEIARAHARTRAFLHRVGLIGEAVPHPAEAG